MTPKSKSRPAPAQKRVKRIKAAKQVSPCGCGYNPEDHFAEHHPNCPSAPKIKKARKRVAKK